MVFVSRLIFNYVASERLRAMPSVEKIRKTDIFWPAIYPLLPLSENRVAP